MEEVDIGDRRQVREVEGKLAVQRRAAGVAGQDRFHEDIFSDIQIQQLVITIHVGGEYLHQRGGIAVGIGGIELERDAGQAGVVGVIDAGMVGGGVAVNMAVDRSCRGIDTDGAGGSRHGIAIDVRGVVHRGGVVRRAALTDDFHCDVVSDDGIRRERRRVGEVRPDQTARARAVVGDGGGDKLIICGAERVFERQIVDDGVADVLDRYAEDHVAADGHRRVGGAQQIFGHVQRRLADQQCDGRNICGRAAVGRGEIRRRARRGGGGEVDGDVGALAGREVTQTIPRQNSGTGGIGRRRGGNIIQLAGRIIIRDDHIRQRGAAGVDHL